MLDDPLHLGLLELLPLAPYPVAAPRLYPVCTLGGDSHEDLLQLDRGQFTTTAADKVYDGFRLLLNRDFGD